MVTIEEANQALVNNKVRWVQCHFSDMLGNLRSFTIPSHSLVEGDAWQNGVGVNASPIPGFRGATASDLVGRPDPNSLKILPWGEADQRSARVVLNLWEPTGEFGFGGDPRGVTLRAYEQATEMNIDKTMFGAQPSLHLVRSLNLSLLENNIAAQGGDGPASFRVIPDAPESYDFQNYAIRPGEGAFQVPPIDQTNAFRNELGHALSLMGLHVTDHQHNSGAGGHVGFSWRADGTVVEAADNVALFKLAARQIAAQHGMMVTFMPKPLIEGPSASMPIQSSLWQGNTPLFYNEQDPNALSDTARAYIGGILAHSEALTAIFHPTVNSYKDPSRPGYATWGIGNRTSYLRVPAYARTPDSVRVQTRSIDAAANPYLAMGALLAAGLDGVKNNLDPGTPTNMDSADLSEEYARQNGYLKLPTSLGDALEALQSDQYILDALGSGIVDGFVEAKRAEIGRFSSYVGPQDFVEYFNL